MAVGVRRPALLIEEHHAVKRKGVFIGYARYRRSADGSIGFWQIKRTDSMIWEGEHETLLEAEGYLTGVER